MIMVISTLEMAQAQDALMAAVADIDDQWLRQDSRCDGWTRGHVLSHIARNADGMVNLAHWAQTGETTPMYESGDRRNADIAQGATRSAAEILDDLVDGNERVLAAFGTLEGQVAVDPSVAAREVRLGDPVNGRAVPVRDLPFLRLQEVVVHHHDLDDGVAARDWPRAYVDEALPRAAATMGQRVTAMPTLVAEDDDVVRTFAPGGSAATTVEVRGPAAVLLVWLLGRATATDRAALSATGGDLPVLPNF